MRKWLFVLLIFMSEIGMAKDYRILLNVENLPEGARPILLRMYNGNMYVVDSTTVTGQGRVRFDVSDSIPAGMLRCVLGMSDYTRFGGGQPVHIDFIFNNEEVELKLDFKNPVGSVEVIVSKENRIYFEFLKSEALFYSKLGLLEQVVLNYPDKDEFYQKALEYYRRFQVQRGRVIDKTFAAYPKTLAGRIIKNQKVPVTDGGIPLEQRDSLFKADFLKLVDFNDTVLLYTSVYTDKIFQYLQMFISRSAMHQENEANCIQALDKIVPLLDVNPVIQQHLLQFLITGFESMQMEEVLAHISSNYLQQCGGSTDVIKRRLEGYRKMAIGQQVPDFTVYDLEGNPVNLYSDMSPYKLILFWHTKCGHCQMLMERLPTLVSEGVFAERQIKIIGISIDETKEDWLDFSKGYALDWTNAYIAGSFDSEVAFDYNLYATPTMFLVDAEYHIVAKPMTVEELLQDIGKL